MADSLQPGFTLTIKIERKTDPLHELTGIPEDPEGLGVIGGVYDCDDLDEVIALMRAGLLSLMKTMTAARSENEEDENRLRPEDLL